MMKRIVAAAFIAVLFVAGCVIRTEHTIDAHITLDIRHIREQAEEVLDFIEGKTDTLPGLDESAARDGVPDSWVRFALNAVHPVQVAHASGLKTSSARVTEIASSLRERNADISRLKSQGCLGENNRGYVELRECDAITEAEDRNAAQQLLADENRDRKALYNEIARLNAAEGATVSSIEGVYALERISRAGSGEWIQVPPAGDLLTEFKKTDLGRRLGDNARAGQWVQVP